MFSKSLNSTCTQGAQLLNTWLKKVSDEAGALNASTTCSRPIQHEERYVSCPPGPSSEKLNRIEYKLVFLQQVTQTAIACYRAIVVYIHLINFKGEVCQSRQARVGFESLFSPGAHLGLSLRCTWIYVMINNLFKGGSKEEKTVRDWPCSCQGGRGEGRQGEETHRWYTSRYWLLNICLRYKCYHSQLQAKCVCYCKKVWII